MPLSTEDRLEIQSLYARYCHSVDAHDGDAWAACFIRDGTFVPGQGAAAGRLIAGRDALAAFAAGETGRPAGRLWTSGLLVDERDGIVEGTCYGMLVQATRGGGVEIAASVVYFDELAKEDGAWRFQSRRPRRDP